MKTKFSMYGVMQWIKGRITYRKFPPTEHEIKQSKCYEGEKAMIPQTEYFEHLQRFIDDNGYWFIVKQLAILAAMKGDKETEAVLLKCYEALEH